MSPSPWPDRGCRYVDGEMGYDDLIGALVDRGAFIASEQIDPAGLAPKPLDDSSSQPVTKAMPASGSCARWPTARWIALRSSCCRRRLRWRPPSVAGVGAVVLAAQAGVATAAAGQTWRRRRVHRRGSALADYRAEPYARVIADAIAARAPNAVLFAATTTDATSLLGSRRCSAPGSRRTAPISTSIRGHVSAHLRRDAAHGAPGDGGGVLATCLCPEARPQMATVRPGVFDVSSSPRRPRVDHLDVSLSDTDLRVEVIERCISTADVDLRDADVVIAGGAGCDVAGWHHVEDLARAIGGRVAASRGAVEAGLAERGAAGRSNRGDRPPSAVHRLRHLRRAATCRRHAGFGHHRRHQPRPEGHHLPVGPLRHRRRCR